MKNTTFKRLMKMVLLLPLMPIIGIPGEGGSGEGGGTGGSQAKSGADGGSGAQGGSGGSEGEKGGRTENGAGKSYTQEEVNALIDKRMAKERSKFDKQLEAIKKATAGESEGGEGEGKSGDGKSKGAGGTDGAAQAEAVLALANQRLITAEAVSAAVQLGVDPKFTADLVRLTDLSKVTVDELGKVDTKTISAELSKTLARLPMFKKDTQGGGFRVGGDGSQGKGAANANGWVDNSKTPAQGQPNKPWNRFNR